jgi:hypothetical protein
MIILPKNQSAVTSTQASQTTTSPAQKKSSPLDQMMQQWRDVKAAEVAGNPVHHLEALRTELHDTKRELKLQKQTVAQLKANAEDVAALKTNG